jgi:hypothetical protein
MKSVADNNIPLTLSMSRSQKICYHKVKTCTLLCYILAALLPRYVCSLEQMVVTHMCSLCTDHQHLPGLYGQSLHDDIDNFVDKRAILVSS